MKYALLTLIAALCLSAIANAQNADPYKGVLSYDFGKSRADQLAIEQEIRAASPDKFKAIEAKLIAAIKDPQASVEAKRFLCRMLAITGSADCVPAVAPLLRDEKTSHMARYALQSMADPAAGAALRQALAVVKDKKLLAGIVGSIAARRDGEAVAAVASLAGDSDATLAGAAITALGQIGTTDAAKALSTMKAPEPLKLVVIRAQLAAAQRMADAGKGAEAAPVFRGLYDAKQPPFIRIAAFRGLLAAQDAAASAKVILDTLGGGDAAMRDAALSVIVSSRDKSLRNVLAEQLPGLKPEAQLALLQVLGDQSDANLRPALLAIINNTKDDAVKSAALDGLVIHGQGEDVPMLVKLAGAGDNLPARRVLGRMQREGVDAALLAMLQGKDSDAKVVAINVLADRRPTGGLQAIVKMVGDADAKVANEALKALGAVGGPDEVAGLVAVLASAKDSVQRDSAANAIKSICARVTDKTACGKPVLAALASAKDAPVRIALVQILPRVGDADSLAAVTKTTADADNDVKESAVRALAEWPDPAACAPLLNLAKTTGNQTHAILALRGAIRLAGNVKDYSPVERVNTLKGVIDIAKREDEKKQAVAALGGVSAPQALEALRAYMKDPALDKDAAGAAVRLAKELGPVYQKIAMAALNEAKAMDIAQLKQPIEEAMAAVKSFGITDGFVMAWVMAGPYEGPSMFDEKFAPETKEAGAISWRPVLADKDKKIVDLLKAIGGENRAAYLRTQIKSDKSQDAVLEFGSDDGIRGWLNGQEIIAKNVTRACTPGEDKVKVKLKEGTNVLLLKITQGGGDWAAVARLRTVDGKDLPGVGINLGEE